jgi:hypothetical protein
VVVLISFRVILAPGWSVTRRLSPGKYADQGPATSRAELPAFTLKTFEYVNYFSVNKSFCRKIISGLDVNSK